MRIVKILLSIIVGLVVGSLVNMGMILLSGHIIPPPAGADVTTAEGLRASLHLFEPKHFVFPFLAHALGTLAGAFTVTKLLRGFSWVPAMTIGAFFFLGGILSARMLPAPTWFVVVDIALAYFPFAWLGWILGRPRKHQ